MIALIIVSGIAALIAVLLLIPLYISIRYVYNEKSGIARIHLKYLWFRINLVPRSKKKNAEKTKKKKKTDGAKKEGMTVSKLKGYAQSVVAVWDDICEVLEILTKKAVCIKELGVYSKFGFDDPMTTGLVTGAANAFVYNIISVIDNNSNLERYNVSLNPDFDNPQLSVRLQSIIKIKNVHIIVIVIKLIRIFFKIK